MNRRDVGAWGEAVALKHLQKTGYKLLERNYRAGRFEIDLIMMDGGTIVFVEVKARRSDRFGVGAERVGPQKQQHIIKAAQMYLLRFKDGEYSARFDVVDILLPEGSFEHYKGAFIC